MYGVLYALSPELFPTKSRGTGNGIMVRRCRLHQWWLYIERSSQAPIIALYADLSTSVPIYVAGTLFLVSGLLALLLPFEPRGRASI